MSRSLPRQFALPFLVCLSLAAAPMWAQRPDNDRQQRHPDDDRHEGGPDRTIAVDCTQGGSIQRALQRFPERTEPITIEVHGFCEGPIDISRQVVIRGTNPATDGITGGASLGNRTGLVVVYGVSGFGLAGAESVRFEHLTIKDSPNLGLTVNVAQVGLSDVVIRDNHNHGMLAFGAAYIFGDHVTATGNGGSGFLTSGGQIRCDTCDISGNGVVNATAPAINAGPGQTFLWNSTVIGFNGIVVANGGELFLTGGSVTATQRALNIQSAGLAFLQNNAQLSGGVFCGAQGLLDSRRGTGTNGLTQTSTGSGGSNQITYGCLFLAGAGTTTFAGQTTVSVGSYVGTDGGNQAIVQFSALNCLTGGKVTTNGGSIIVNNVPGIPAACGT